ncbi:MAG: cytochrome c oxidase assembly protein [Rhodospirillaceae bacterium]|nr:cytochrome c oxidase assembly protein [Rhodospirillaceae bacterium]
MNRTAARRNGRTAFWLAGVLVAMIGLTAASVPLYRLFCQVTGFGGTTQRAETAPGAVGSETVTIRFNADSMQQLGWEFQPVERAVTVRVGEPALAYYRAHNLTARPSIGNATFNVTPLDAGQYFVKVDCFCFTEQALAPGETVDMPVQFYVDPAILDDPDFDQLRTITLSYTFFPAEPESNDAQLSEADTADETIDEVN